MKRHRLLRKLLFKPKIYPEAFFAYFNKLPNQVSVSWFREDGLIIGEVNAGGKKFVTQGNSPEDFIDMVNRSIVTMYEIPEDYVDVINQTKTYLPPESERRLLEDKTLMRHQMGFTKSENAFKLA